MCVQQASSKATVGSRIPHTAVQGPVPVPVPNACCSLQLTQMTVLVLAFQIELFIEDQLPTALPSFSFFLSFFLSLSLPTKGCLYVALDVLKLPLWIRLTSNSTRSACLCLPQAGIKRCELRPPLPLSSHCFPNREKKMVYFSEK